MSSMERFGAAIIDVKDGPSPGFTAIGSTSTIDLQNESLQYGCFNPLPPMIKCHADHRLSVENVVAKARPYYSGGKLLLDGTWAPTEKAQMLRELVTGGYVDSMSVVFTGAKREVVKGVTTVTKGRLIACDFVSIPANPEAMVLTARSVEDQRAIMAAKAAVLQLQIDLEEMALADARREIAEAKAFLRGLGRGAGPLPRVHQGRGR